ncbi:MAG: DegT/DnrJ/EryC1/StrS family aminotransferase [Kiritimatiellia bacterium]
MPDMIPVYQPWITDAEKRNVLECLESSWISSKGRFISEFETRFSATIGVRHAAAVSNGTVAMHLTMLALDIGPGDEVIVPTFTYIASVNPVLYVGATPVFVDSEPAAWQIDPDRVEAAITPRTRAIVVAHLYGHPADMHRLQAIARRHGVHLIEDCAEALGARIGGVHAGSWADISAFSFFGNKTITTGEGGMVATNDPALDDRIRRLKGQGLAANRTYWHDLVGYNFRMTNICAAIGCAQLERFDRILAEKRRVAGGYRRAFAGGPVRFHDSISEQMKHGFWMCSILVPRADQRDPLMAALAAQGIETRPGFYPVHTMPMYTRFSGRFPVAEDLAARAVNLPSWPMLTDGQVAAVAGRVLEGIGTVS